MTQQAYIKASNPGDGANFGSSVALSRDGNTMAVAAYYESSAATGINGNQADRSIPEAGAVYVFARTGTTWSQQAYIKASNTGNAAVGDGFAEGDQFGYSIALSADGNTLAVGAIGEDSNATGINGDQADNSANQAGAAYVFTRTGSTWSQQAYVKSSMTRPNVLFGYSIGAQRERRHARRRRVRCGSRQGRALRARRAAAAPGRIRPASRPTTRRTATRSATRWPSATTATPSRRARPTRTA